MHSTLREPGETIWRIVFYAVCANGRATETTENQPGEICSLTVEADHCQQHHFDKGTGSLLSHNFSQQGELCAVDGVMGVWWIAAQQWQQRSPFEQIQLQQSQAVL